MTQHYLDDTERLGLGRPDHEPLASDYIEPIVALIADLVEGGHAYAVDGDVYFRVRSLPEYGELSHRAVDQMDQGEGVEGADRKEDPLDFALWKGEKEDEDTAWPSPWGPGRPGWHIECSAMAEELLGVELDIHGGGADLLFPHHENEAAQTLAARGKPLARLWMHNGMLQLAAEKMSKSEGNIRGLGEALDEVGRDALLMYFVAGHYRQPIAYTRERLDAAAASVERVREAGRRVDRRRVAGGARAAARRLLRRAGRRLQHRAGAGEPVRLDPRGEPARGAGRRLAPARDARGAGARQPARRRRGPARRAPRPGAAAHRGACAQGLRRGGPAPRRGARRGLGHSRWARRPGVGALGVTAPASRGMRPFAAARRSR